ncbi:MAG: DUF1957 domain-containing protein [Actinobacteria bacterium]|nr:DUF1957 domain-containing protein [Actinomycetota bacterium]
MGEANIALLLHTHMPYVRRNVDWPVGEQWILEAWAECYIPVWDIVADMSEGSLPGKLAMTVTPVLCEQLTDPHLQRRFDDYLDNRIRQAEGEIARLRDMGEEARSALASFYRDRLRELRDLYRERFRHRMLETLREGMEAGVLEVLASSATHAHLPLLPCETCRRAQVAVGLESYRRAFGREPRGFWLPECAYTPDLDGLLRRFSPPISYVVLDFSAAEGDPLDNATWRPRRLGSTPLVALLRDPLAHRLVWAEDGYPSGGSYRDYSKKDHEGHGFQYWRITSHQTPIDDKEVYVPERALAAAEGDARDFAQRIRARLHELAAEGSAGNASPLVLIAYDTELFGHWWYEGPFWLRHVLRHLHPRLVLPGDLAVQAHRDPLPAIAPSVTAWNVDGTFATWRNPRTADMWEETRRAEEEFLSRVTRREKAGTGRALAQAARELLILEASDWPYMVTREAAAEYARLRFRSHRDRLSLLLKTVDEGEEDGDLLRELEETDNLFPWLETNCWR